MFRKETWTIENEKELHKQLRQNKRQEIINKKRISSIEQQNISSSVEQQSQEQISLLINQLNSHENNEIIESLHSIHKLLMSQSESVILLLKNDILLKLSEFLKNRNNIYLINIVVSIISELSSTKNMTIINKMIDLEIAKELVRIVSNEYKVAYSNIFEESYNALANIMSTNDKFRDICISYGFLSQFFDLCSHILSVDDSLIDRNENIAKALCYVMYSLTCGETSCSVQIAKNIIDFVIQFGMKFGYGREYILLIFINFSNHGTQYIQLLMKNENFVEFLKYVVKTNSSEGLLHVLKFIQESKKQIPEIMEKVFPLVEILFENLHLTSSSFAVYHDSCVFLKWYMRNMKYTKYCHKYIRNNIQFIRSLIEKLDDSNKDIVCETIELLHMIIKGYQDVDVLVYFCCWNLVEQSLQALKKQFIVERTVYVRVLLDLILMALQLEESKTVKSDESIRETPFVEWVSSPVIDYKSEFIRRSPSFIFGHNNGIEVMEYLLVECVEISKEIMIVLNLAESLMKSKDDTMKL